MDFEIFKRWTGGLKISVIFFNMLESNVINSTGQVTRLCLAPRTMRLLIIYFSLLLSIIIVKENIKIFNILIFILKSFPKDL